MAGRAQGIVALCQTGLAVSAQANHGAHCSCSSLVGQCRTAAGGKVDAVVAGTARYATRLGGPVGCIDGLGAVMAHTAHLLTTTQHGETFVVEGDAGIGVVLFHQLLAVVNLVDHRGEITRDFAVRKTGVRGVTKRRNASHWVDRFGFSQCRESTIHGCHVGKAVLALVVVAHHAELGVNSGATTMERQFFVTGVAGLNGHHFTHQIGGRNRGLGVRHKVVDQVDRVCCIHARCNGSAVVCVATGTACCATQLHHQAVWQFRFPRQVAQGGLVVGSGNRHRIDGSLDGGDITVERVGISTRAIFRHRTGVIGRGTRWCRSRCGGGHRGHDVIDPRAWSVCGRRDQLGNRECQIDVASLKRCGVLGSIL